MMKHVPCILILSSSWYGYIEGQYCHGWFACTCGYYKPMKCLLSLQDFFISLRSCRVHYSWVEQESADPQYMSLTQLTQQYIYIYRSISSPASIYGPTEVWPEGLGNIMHLIPMPAGYTSYSLREGRGGVLYVSIYVAKKRVRNMSISTYNKSHSRFLRLVIVFNFYTIN